MLVTICESSGDGHRLNYVSYFATEAAAAGHGSRVQPSLLRAALVRGPLVLPMLEQRSVANIVTMTLRALCGRRTVTLVFRAGDAIRSGGARFAFKRALLGFVRRLPRVGVISIVPVPVDPRIGRLVNGWIYDPELCDLPAAALARYATPATEALRAQAAGRLIVTSLGQQSEDKGFGYLCDIWAAVPAVRERCLFVAAGRSSPSMAKQVEAFVREGGVLIDRRISDEELLDLYEASDLIWCCYAPSYDQASGIFGRAVQFEKPAAIRRGSYTAALAAELEHPAVLVDWNDPPSAARALERSPHPNDAPERGRRNATMRDHNSAVLRPYLA